MTTKIAKIGRQLHLYLLERRKKHNYALKYNLLHNNGKHNLYSPRSGKKDAFAKKAQMVFIRLCESV